MNRYLAIRRQEWVWVIAWSLIILGLTSLPWLYGVLLSTPENQFSGFAIGVEDTYSYLGKMRLGAEGDWQFYLFYTTEPHDGAYLLLFYLLLGKIAGGLGLSFSLVYHLARLIFGFFLLATIYSFIAFFSEAQPVRRLAFLGVGLGSGLGWLVVVTGLVERIGLPLDFYLPEAFAFLLLLGLPHLALAQSLLLWGVLLVVVAWEEQRLRAAVLAGISLLLMTVVAPFYIAVAGAIIGVGIVMRAGYRWSRLFSSPGRKEREESVMRGFWREAGLGTVALLIALPYPFYNAYVFTTNPAFKVWGEQNIILSPAPLHYLLAFGLLAFPALLGGWQVLRQGNLRQLVLVGWGLALPVLIYLPFNLQRRLALGGQVTLAILAALGVWWLWQQRKQLQPWQWRWMIGSSVILLSLSNLMLLLGSILAVGGQNPPVFHSGALVEAADWLDTQPGIEKVVLAGYETANYLPTRMLGRVFVGHRVETIHSEAKIAMLPQFFTGTNDSFRRQLLQEYGITYLFYGAEERTLGDFSPAQATYLEQVYDNGTVQIYRVKWGE